MIDTADLLGMQEEIDRRSFMRRLFAIGAGVAASGVLVRALSALAPSPYGVSILDTIAEPHRLVNVATVADWDALLREHYVQTQIIAAISVATPLKNDLLMSGRSVRRFIGEQSYRGVQLA